MAASDDLKAADAALNRRVRSYTFQGKTYSLTELRDVLLPQLKRAADAEEKAKRKAEETARRERAAASAAEAASAEAKRLEIEAAKSAVAQAQQSLTSKTKAFRDGRATEADLRKAENELAAAQTRLATAQGQTAPAAAAGVPTPVTGRAVLPSTGGIRIPTRGERGETTLADVTAGEPPPSPPPPPIGGAGDKRKKKKASAAGAQAADDSFLDELAATFPTYADWKAADAIAYFGNDLIDVFRKINDGIYDTTTAEGRAGVQRAIEQTSYWRTTQASIKNWDQLAEPDRQKRITDQKALIATSYGDLGLDDATLTDLATIAQRTGLTELGLKQMVYGRAFARPATATLDTRALALEGGAADQIRAVGRAYGYTPSAAEIESILTGKPLAGTGTVLTEDALRQKAQKAAKGQYGWLADQIDAGLSLDDIFTNYRNYAARTLQKDPSEIDFTNPLYAEAFGSKETGQLSLNDWTRKLKTDKRYGWQYTDEANQQVNAVVSTLERAFGLVK